MLVGPVDKRLSICDRPQVEGGVPGGKLSAMSAAPIYPAQQDIAVFALRDLLIKKGIITSAEFVGSPR
jgi:hypothetical protein